VFSTTLNNISVISWRSRPRQPLVCWRRTFNSY
jgi:hypothetical protein